jgi:DNA-binding transcriptional regulator YdaS (Cro superfamily)
MDSVATPFEALKAAVARAGSQSAFARLLGVGQPAVWKWLQSSKRLPPQHVLAAERETGVSRHLLRPDIYPPETPSPSPNLERCASALERMQGGVGCDHQPVSQRSAA